jgi:fermentation-respiration switch protein FrsA (DUF1100 family)
MTLAFRRMSRLAAALISLFLAYMLYAGLVGSNQLLYPKRDNYRQPPSAYGIPFQPLSLVSADGLHLVGWYVPAAKSTHQGIVLLHGFGSNKDDAFKRYGLWLHPSYNLLIYDSRDSGASPGKFCSLGYFERKDALGAINELKRRGNTAVGLLGESMGGAVAIEAAALSPSVKAVWSDCAFDSLADTVAPRAALQKYPFPNAVGFVVVTTASLRLHANMFKADPIHWVAKMAPRPLYLVHGLADDRATPLNAQKLYDAARSPKTLWWTSNAHHAESYKLYPAEYKKRALAFFAHAL